MADEQAGWEINGRFYPHNGADALRHGDFALIREVTGMSLDDFDRGDDPLATETGWLAVAVWQAQPELRRGQVRDFIETLPAGAATRVGWGADDAAPLTPDGSPASGSSSNDSVSQPADSTSPSPSPSTTKSTAAPTPEPSNPPSSGDPPSATGATPPPPSSEPSTGGLVLPSRSS